MMPDPDIPSRLRAVNQAIAEAEAACGRQAGAVTLVAVGKTHGAGPITQALVAGQAVFGENRIQEAEQKWPALKQAWPPARLHLIGPLQRNKLARALTLFDVIETLDRPKLADALARMRDEGARLPELFAQINTGEEPQKAGVLPADADAFIRRCLDDLALPVSGLMCIPPVADEPALHFALLADMAARNGLAQLSMGMSADFETAIRFGATHVRVGTAIFGERRAVNPG